MFWRIAGQGRPELANQQDLTRRISTHAWATVGCPLSRCASSWAMARGRRLYTGPIYRRRVAQAIIGAQDARWHERW